MIGRKFLTACAVCGWVGLAVAPAARAQPPERTQETTVLDPQQEIRERQALERRSPDTALQQFVQGIDIPDLGLAAGNVEGEPGVEPLSRLETLLKRLPGPLILGITPLAGKALAAGNEFEARIVVSLRLSTPLLQDQPLSSDAVIQSKTTFIERVTMRRDKSGEWKIVPRPAPAPLEAAATAASATGDERARAQALEVLAQAGAGEGDGWVNAWARIVAQPRTLLAQSAADASIKNLKQLLASITRLAANNGQKYAFSTDDFFEKLLPYAGNKELFLAPPIDEAAAFAYTLNPGLAGLTRFQAEPAPVVALYEGGPDGKPLFRFAGRALIGFADGSVALVTPQQAAKLKWQAPPQAPDAAPQAP